jgi:Ribonuclease HII
VQICAKAIAWHIGAASHFEIDKLNILHASHLAMQRAVAGLQVKPSKVLVDGNKCPKFSCPAEAIVEGDKLIEQISAASIVAKVFRDRSMVLLDQQFPGYGFAKHKGYGTAAHIAALNLLGPIKEHRRSYAPVALAASRIDRLILLKV